MIRLGTILWLLLVGCSGYAMFQVKYEVAKLDEQLAQVNRATAAEVEATRVLEAEWSYLDRAARLEPLAKRYLNLGRIGTHQIGRVEDLPSRKLPENAAPGPHAPETAANTGAAAGPHYANANPRATR